MHITKWNFAYPSWHFPNAKNDMIIGWKYLARMEAKDGTSGFDFEAIYSTIRNEQQFTYGFGERNVTVKFVAVNNQTEITVKFDPETENP